MQPTNQDIMKKLDRVLCLLEGKQTVAAPSKGRRILPLLAEILKDGKPHSSVELADIVAAHQGMECSFNHVNASLHGALKKERISGLTLITVNVWQIKGGL